MKPAQVITPNHCECGDHAWAPIGRGFVTLVSPEDAHHLTRKWRPYFQSTGRPAVMISKSFPRSGMSRKFKTFWLHREIIGHPDTPFVDHKNRNPLDNRRHNIRPATYQENSRNRTLQRGSKSSVFKGVFFCRQQKRWIAGIKISGRQVYLGRYRNETDAAIAYDSACLKYFGEFAAPNFEIR